jgi:5-methylcytosine-specific restriction endonuclease McrA
LLHADKTASFQPASLFGGKLRFHSSRASAPGRVVRRSELQQVLVQQQGAAVAVHIEGRTTWWSFRNKFYWDDDGLSQREVMALILDRERKKTRQVERAVAAMDGRAPSASSRRERIPEAVQNAVWNRDQGRCVQCGSRERLEFDHIIPVARGGGNTARNLQLLCESCNRSKGVGSLADLKQALCDTPANWLPDPRGRHQLRYWDGSARTSYVSDNGATGLDDV